MEEILLNDDLKIGERQIGNINGEPYLVYDFYAKKGSTLRRDPDGALVLRHGRLTRVMPTSEIPPFYKQEWLDKIWEEAKKLSKP